MRGDGDREAMLLSQDAMAQQRIWLICQAGKMTQSYDSVYKVHCMKPMGAKRYGLITGAASIFTEDNKLR